MQTFFIYFLIAINFLAFTLYALDKLIALRLKQNFSRISEKNLLLIAFLGGSLGASLAMFLFNHKTKKLSFMWRFFAIVLLHVSSIAIITIKLL